MAQDELAWTTLDVAEWPSFAGSFGPFVITYIAPDAELIVESVNDDVSKSKAGIHLKLRGKDFRGQFYVGKGYRIKAASKSCIISGFYFRVDTTTPGPRY